MGTYRAVESDHLSVRLIHEPIAGGSEVIEFRNPSEFVRGQVQRGKRYVVSLSFTEHPEDPAPAKTTPLPNTVENEQRSVASEVGTDVIGPHVSQPVEETGEVEGPAEPEGSVTESEGPEAEQEANA